MNNNSKIAPAHRIQSGSLVGRYLAVGLIGLLTVSTVLQRVEAADGDLDLTFGSGGKVVSNFFFIAVAIQSNGKIIAAGGAPVADPAILNGFGLARYNSDGSLDPTFGSGGQVTTLFSTPEFVRALAIQSDGKIIATGVLGDVVRYNRDGTLDTAFATAGKLKADFDVSSVAIQSDGRVVLAGNIFNNPSDTDFALARYNANGSADVTFGSSGKVITAFSSSYDSANAVVIQSDGRIIAAGYSNNIGSFALARYNVDGSLDNTFGSGGRVQAPSAGLALGSAATLQPDGKILVAGAIVNQNTSYDFALARYNSDGSLDQTFGSGGRVTTDFNGDDLGSDVALQADGKIIVVGKTKDTSRPSPAYHFGLVRYNGNGSLDTTFGSAGRVTTVISNDGDLAISVAIQNDGRTVVSGSVGNPFVAGALVRYDSLAFDICVQDDGNANILKISSTTGDYLFTNCAGTTLGGKGILVKRGSLVTLQDYSADRRVVATYDGAVRRATASIRVLSSGRTFSITDRDTANNTCGCP